MVNHTRYLPGSREVVETTVPGQTNIAFIETAVSHALTSTHLIDLRAHFGIAQEKTLQSTLPQTNGRPPSHLIIPIHGHDTAHYSLLIVDLISQHQTSMFSVGALVVPEVEFDLPFILAAAFDAARAAKARRRDEGQASKKVSHFFMHHRLLRCAQYERVDMTVPHGDNVYKRSYHIALKNARDTLSSILAESLTND